MTNTHQLAFHWPQLFGLLAMLANIAVAIVIKHDPRSQTKLTLAAVGVTVLAVSVLLPQPTRTRSTSNANPTAEFYPSATPPPASIPAALEYRSL